MKKSLAISSLAVFALLLSGCAAIGDIFKTGMGVGIFVVVIVVIVIIFIVRSFSSKS